MKWTLNKKKKEKDKSVSHASQKKFMGSIPSRLFQTAPKIHNVC